MQQVTFLVVLWLNQIGVLALVALGIEINLITLQSNVTQVSITTYIVALNLIFCRSVGSKKQPEEQAQEEESNKTIRQSKMEVKLLSGSTLFYMVTLWLQTHFISHTSLFMGWVLKKCLKIHMPN